MIVGVVTLLAVALAYAFWPRAIMVDIGEVARAPMLVSIDEEAKTRVRDAYVVSTPVAGRLLRVDMEPGDVVESGRTTIARMLPEFPSVLDARTREQATAAVKSAEASLHMARAERKEMLADRQLAEIELQRARKLRASGMVSQAALDLAERTADASKAALETAQASIAMRSAEIAISRAQLIGFSGNAKTLAGAPTASSAIPLVAPVSGKILRVMQESEATLAPGVPILEIGDISNDLEIVAELLSSDAVQVAAGNRVIIDNWGGSSPLSGIVERVEPWGFTKVSALGVEEQRVNVIIKFGNETEQRNSLGHGFRVNVRIVVWEDPSALTVPSSALFRHNGEWAVFTVREGRAHLKTVAAGRNNGSLAQVLGSLDAGASIVLYPSPGLADGARVEQRNIDRATAR